MVRINLLPPKNLADQHLIAEYAEILMLVEYIRNYPELAGIPAKFCLGTGHQKFFKNKLKYLKKRHEQIRKEMKKRGFNPTKTVNLSKIPRFLIKDWRPNKKDKEIIKKRLRQKISLKPEFYRYYGKKKTKSFLIRLIKQC